MGGYREKCTTLTAQAERVRAELARFLENTHGLPATKGRIYIRVHRLTVSLSCIFVQLNLAFEPSMRYTLG